VHTAALTTRFAAIILSLSSLLLRAPPACARPAAEPARNAQDCGERETAIVIDTRAHQMHLCRQGENDRTYSVALGIRGVGKQRQGDNRTPLGKYLLAAPRASRDFHTFIHVGYPTPAQARMGFTGSAIGIHGPPRGLQSFAELASLVTRDWTAGCIAVATDEEIEQVAAWVREHGVKEVRLVA
jgi:murein L,D-transpeptidase YafK